MRLPDGRRLEGFLRKACFSEAGGLSLVFPALGFDDFLRRQLVGGVVENFVGGIHGLALSLIRAFRQTARSGADERLSNMA
jgi:hypothetical protein